MGATTSQSQPSRRIVWCGATAVGNQSRRAPSTTRSHRFTRTRLLLGLVWCLIGAAALLPLLSSPRIATAQSVPSLHSQLPARCAGIGDGHGLSVWPLSSCAGTQIPLRVAGFKHAQYVFLYLVSPQGDRSTSPLTVRAGADGMLKATVTIPSVALGPGRYLIEAIGLSTGYTTHLAYNVQ